MPVDWIKFSPQESDIKKLLSNKILCFETVSSQDAEVLMETAKYGAFEIIIRKGVYCEIKGSFHKHHSGGENYDDFDFLSLTKVIAELSQKLEIDLSKAVVKNLEIGVNMKILHQNPRDVAMSAFLFKNKFFEPWGLYSKSIGQAATFNQYRVKIYSKETQYGPIAEGILRYEIHWKKMTGIKAILGLDRHMTVNDLQKKSNIERLVNFTVKSIDQVLFRPLDMCEIMSSKPDMKLLKKWSNDIYIKKLKLDNNDKFRREKNRMLRIMKLKPPALIVKKELIKKALILLKR